MGKRILVADFKQRLVESILDPEGTHHEFVSGLHGRKLDFDLISTDSPLFKEWVEVVSQSLQQLYPNANWSQTVLLSVANGTNRLVEPVAKIINSGATALKTEKLTPKSVKLTKHAGQYIRTNKPQLVITIEDVSTKGTTLASAVSAARAAGAKNVEAIDTWQRREKLEELDEIKVRYNSIIKEILPNLEPEECRSKGYCAKGWQFIPHD